MLLFYGKKQRINPFIAKGRWCGGPRIEVTLCNDTVWMTLDQMAELFQCNKSTISHHIKNVFDSGEYRKNQLLHFS